MVQFTLDADAIARQSRNPESTPWMLRRYVWNAMRFDVLTLRATHLEILYEYWLEINEKYDNRPDDMIAFACQYIHTLRNEHEEYREYLTKAERRERRKNRRKRGKEGQA